MHVFDQSIEQLIHKYFILIIVKYIEDKSTFVD